MRTGNDGLHVIPVFPERHLLPDAILGVVVLPGLKAWTRRPMDTRGDMGTRRRQAEAHASGPGSIPMRSRMRMRSRVSAGQYRATPSDEMTIRAVVMEYGAKTASEISKLRRTLSSVAYRKECCMAGADSTLEITWTLANTVRTRTSSGSPQS